MATAFVPVPERFCRFMVTGQGLILPDPPAGLKLHLRDPRSTGDSDAEFCPSDDEEGGKGETAGTPAEDDESEAESVKKPDPFPEFERQLTAAFEKIPGKTFIKLSWTAPRDAYWMMVGGSLECMCSGEVILLLKGSELVVHDLLHAYDGCQDAHAPGGEQPPAVAAAAAGTGGEQEEALIPVTLAIRKWCNFLPGREFRCFVVRGELVAACQRDKTLRFETLQDAGERRDCGLRLATAFRERVLPTLLGRDVPAADADVGGVDGGAQLPDWLAVDVYVEASGRVWVVDIGTFGGETDPLLFDWAELAGMDPIAAGEPCPIRHLDGTAAFGPSLVTMHSMPQEVYELAGDKDKIETLVDAMRRQQAGGSG